MSRDAPAACWLSSDSEEAGGCQKNLRSFSETEGSLYLPAAELRSLLLLGLRTHYLVPRIYSLVSTKPSCREAEKVPKEGKLGGRERAENTYAKGHSSLQELPGRAKVESGAGNKMNMRFST